MRNTCNGELYAVKKLRMGQFMRNNMELDVLETVDHPFLNVMRMSFRSAEFQYFVLDYCERGCLADFRDCMVNEASLRTWRCVLPVAITDTLQGPLQRSS